MVFRNIQWFMDWWFNCVAIEYGYPGENSTLLSRSPTSSEIKTTFVIFSHSKTKFRTMAARIGKYSGCSQRRFRLVFCYWVLRICFKNLCEAKFFQVNIFMVQQNKYSLGKNGPLCRKYLFLSFIFLTQARKL